MVSAITTTSGSRAIDVIHCRRTMLVDFTLILDGHCCLRRTLKTAATNVLRLVAAAVVLSTPLLTSLSMLLLLLLLLL